ncbi:MAG: site-specific integrase, partial [Gammaproteobacteria bacterium]|nr:site-specific integrase [Gammaproteobacteria bacterium]
MKQKEYLENFIQMLRSEKYYSPHTCKNYQRDLSKLAEFLRARDISSWSQVSYNEVSAYAAYRFRNGLKSRSIQRELSSIRSFYQFLIRQGAMKSNPAKEVSAPKGDHRLPKTCDAEQLGHLLHHRRNDDELMVRDLAIFELIYSS